MNAQEYYNRVYDKLVNCFEYNGIITTIEKDFIKDGCDPAFPVKHFYKDKLSYLTKEKGYQVHLPVIGKNSQSVLMPLDFEIFLSDDQYKLYSDKEAQKHYFGLTVPVINFIKKIFTDRGMPFMLDYTPSGGHILFHNPMYQRSTKEIQKIGWLEDGVRRSCGRRVQHQIMRQNGTSLDAASVFSGLGRLAEYIAFLTMNEFKNNQNEGKLPVTISDTEIHCINLDNSWGEGSPWMRSIRSPFSLHRKNQEKYGRFDQPPLVDVVGGVFNGNEMKGEITTDRAVDCMWDLWYAAENSEQFDGYIPSSNDTIIDFIEEYKKSDLYAFHCDFDKQTDLGPGEALYRARKESNVPDWSKYVVDNPNPMAVQPINIKGLVYDFTIRANWHPKHVANLLRDIYSNKSFGWVQDFYDAYPADEKANFWARTFGAFAYWQTDRLIYL